MKKNYHSVPTENKWKAKKEGKNKPISSHNKQSNSEKTVKRLAKKDKVEAVYHKKTGEIRDKDSYGNDPCPPKDTVM